MRNTKNGKRENELNKILKRNSRTCFVIVHDHGGTKNCCKFAAECKSNVFPDDIRNSVNTILLLRYSSL